MLHEELTRGTTSISYKINGKTHLEVQWDNEINFIHEQRKQSSDKKLLKAYC